MKITGGCHCGALTYEAEIDPTKVGICHCHSCQVLSGTSFRTGVHVPIDKFQLHGGPPRTYTKTGGSGQPRAMAFCETCGTQLYGTGGGDSANVISLRIGTCHQRAELKPRREIFRAEAVKWLGDLGVDESHDFGVSDTKPSD
jgi:hypothetical protein